MLRRSSPQTCPGINKFVRPTPEFIKCAFCGAEVEIWSDEESAVCQNCGKTVKRGQEEVSCLEYCPYAEKCKELLASMKKEAQQKEDEAVAVVRVGKIECKTLMGRSGIEDVDYAINPYLGCQHACVYCYARFMGRRGHLGEPWGSFVDVKTNALERLAEELPRRKRGVVLLSSVTDPYQPLEKSWQLTRGALEQLLEYDFPVNVQTKSTLVLRDLDLLQRFSDCEVGFTVTMLDDDVRRIFEPEASPIAERLEALRAIDKAGIRTFAFLGPMLPYLSDRNLEELLVELASAGIDRILVDRLNIKAGNWPPIRRAVERNFQDLLPLFTSALPEGSKYYEELRLKVSNLAQRLGLPTYFCY